MTASELYWTMKAACSLYAIQRILENPRDGPPMHLRLRDAKYHARKLIHHLGVLEAAMRSAEEPPPNPTSKEE